MPYPIIYAASTQFVSKLVGTDAQVVDFKDMEVSGAGKNQNLNIYTLIIKIELIIRFLILMFTFEPN